MFEIILDLVTDANLLLVIIDCLINRLTCVCIQNW